MASPATSTYLPALEVPHEREGVGTELEATLHELAAEYKVSAERIRQIESNAIAKLKTQMVPVEA